MPEGTKPLRVLFLTRYPVSGASSRYRVYQYVPHLESGGVQCTVQSFMDESLYALSFSPGRTVAKLWQTAKAVVALWAVASEQIVQIFENAMAPFLGGSL